MIPFVLILTQILELVVMIKKGNPEQIFVHYDMNISNRIGMELDFAYEKKLTIILRTKMNAEKRHSLHVAAAHVNRYE